jgi:hypothetical protein
MSTPSNSAGVTQDKERVARPTLVWVICAFYALGAVGMALSFVRLYTGGLPLTPAQAHYFQSLSTFDVVASLTIQLIHVTAVVLLFLMRKQAAYLFPAGLVIGLVLTGFHAVTKGWVAAMGEAGLVGMLIGWGVGIAVCLYVWRLLRRHMLR